LDNFPLADRVIQRENFGREAGHYLNYLIENYDNLPETIALIQGDPWPHAATCGNPCALLELFFGTPGFFYPMCYIGGEYAPAHGLTPIKGTEHHEALDAAWQGEPMSRSIRHTTGAMLYVKRSVVLARPADHYKRLLEKGRDKTRYKDDPYYTLAHTLEGFWGCVFAHEKLGTCAL
jgi:hypothetical protein